MYQALIIKSKKAEAISKPIMSADDSVRYEGVCKEIESENDLLPYLEKADLVFNAFGYFAEEQAKKSISGFITKASILTKTPMYCLSSNWMGPLYIPDITPCYFCAVNHEKLQIILTKVKKNPRVEKRAFCPVLSISCSLAVLDVVRYLTGIGLPKTVGGISSIDPFNIEKNSFFPIDRDKNCIYCG